MRTRSYASVRHLHFVEDLEYHFVDGYGELINTSTHVNIFEHKKISTAFGWLSSAGRCPQALELAEGSVAMLRFHMAFLLIVGLVGEGVKVADDTATQTPEEWQLVFERD